MLIKCIKVGELEENCYLLKMNNEYLIIDPGDEAEKIEKEIDGNVVGVLITHHHFDHVGALEEIKDKYNSPVYDYSNLKNGPFEIIPFNFNVIYTPGHSKDSISFLFKEFLFCGDFLFDSSIGRCDLPGGDYNEMKKSIKKILSYNDNILVFPGHGDNTSLGNERNNLLSYK